MAQVVVNQSNTPFDLGFYISNLGVDQVTNDQINVICDTTLGSLTIILPRCPVTAANIKILVIDAAKNASNNNITLVAAKQTEKGIVPAYGQDLINGVDTFTIANNSGFALIQMAYPSVLDFINIPSDTFGYWVASFNSTK